VIIYLIKSNDNNAYFSTLSLVPLIYWMKSMYVSPLSDNLIFKV